MKKWGFIHTPGDTSAQSRTDTIGSSACVLPCVGASRPEDAPASARKLLDEGVELIELCGAFAGMGLGDVVAAVESRVPVGAVFYCGEAGTGLHKLVG